MCHHHKAKENHNSKILKDIGKPKQKMLDSCRYKWNIAWFTYLWRISYTCK